MYKLVFFQADNESNFSIRHLTLHDGEIKVYDYVMETENLDKVCWFYFFYHHGIYQKVSLFVKN